MTWASPSHITFGLFGLGPGLGLQGMPISLGFWEWGCPKRGDAHITVTAMKKSGASFLRLFKGKSCA